MDTAARIWVKNTITLNDQRGNTLCNSVKIRNITCSFSNSNSLKRKITCFLISYNRVQVTWTITSSNIDSSFYPIESVVSQMLEALAMYYYHWNNPPGVRKAETTLSLLLRIRLRSTAALRVHHSRSDAGNRLRDTILVREGLHIRLIMIWNSLTMSAMKYLSTSYITNWYNTRLHLLWMLLPGEFILYIFQSVV